MADNLVIMDFSNDFISAGVFAPRKLELIESFTESVADSLKDALSLLLRRIKEKGYDGFSNVFVGIPARDVGIRMLDMPFADERKIKDVLPFEIEGIISKEMDDVIIDAVSYENKAVAVIVEKKTLHEYLNLLSEFNIDPARIGCSLFSKGRFLKEIEGISLFMDGDSIVVCRDGKPHLFKAKRCDMDLRLVLANLSQDGFEIGKVYYIGRLNNELKDIFEKANLTPLYQNAKDISCSPQMSGVIALSMHLNEGLKGIVNFRKGEFGYTKDAAKAKRSLMFTAALSVVLFGLITGYFYMRYKMIDNEISKARNDLAAGYAKLFPDEPRPVDALYQLEAKLKALKDEKRITGSGVDMLGIMKLLSSSLESGLNVRLNELSVDGKRATAKGEADSFESAARFKNAAQKIPNFGSVLLTDVKTKVENRVGFGISIVMADKDDK